MNVASLFWRVFAVVVVVLSVFGCARIRDHEASKAAQPTAPAAPSPPAARATPTETSQSEAQTSEADETESAEDAEEGMASYYGAEFEGKETASGEIFDKEKLTAAHKSLPLGTKAKVTNVETGESVEVEINDRGPNVGGRIIDLSERAAEEIGVKDDGVEKVKVETVETKK